MQSAILAKGWLLTSNLNNQIASLPPEAMLWLLGIDYDSIWAAMLVSQKAVPTTEILELEDCEEHLQLDKKSIGLESQTAPLKIGNILNVF